MHTNTDFQITIREDRVTSESREARRERAAEAARRKRGRRNARQQAARHRREAIRDHEAEMGD